MTTFQLKRVSELSDSDWSLWRDIQERDATYESPYFHPDFARCVAAVRSDVEVAVIEEQGEAVGFLPFQRGTLNLGKPVGGKMSDYHGPIIRSEVQLDAHKLLEACKLATWDFDHLVCATPAFEKHTVITDKSPQMDLSVGFEAYSRGRRLAGSDAVHRQGQKGRKLAREVGPLQFAFDADDQEAYDALLRWKTDQYKRTGLTDVFSFPWTLELLAKLREHSGVELSAPLSVLRAGDTIAAVCLSLRSRGVLHSWFPAYNPDLSSYSPGLALFVWIAEEAERLGIRKIDLGRGEERYKWSLASGSVEVAEGSVARGSLATLLRSSWRHARDWVKRSPFAGSTRLLKPFRAWIAYQ